MSSIHQLNFHKIRLLKIGSILRILIILIGISSSASAQSLDRYCLSTAGKIETANKKARVFDPTPPLPYFIDSVENLPELYKKPCTKFSRYFWGCDRETFFFYSPTLNRVFIQGYRQTDWGEDFAHLEISKFETKSVPYPLIHSGFLEDVPTLDGVVFKSDGGEALFYNGRLVTNLSSYFPEQEKRKKSNGRNWNLKKTIEERIFIADNGFYSEHFPFVMELKTGVSINFIDVPKKSC